MLFRVYVTRIANCALGFYGTAIQLVLVQYRHQIDGNNCYDKVYNSLEGEYLKYPTVTLSSHCPIEVYETPHIFKV